MRELKTIVSDFEQKEGVIIHCESCGRIVAEGVWAVLVIIKGVGYLPAKTSVCTCGTERIQVDLYETREDALAAQHTVERDFIAEKYSMDKSIPVTPLN